MYPPIVSMPSTSRSFSPAGRAGACSGYVPATRMFSPSVMKSLALRAIELIVDLADELFDHIFERDQSLRRAVFIDDHRHVRLAGLKLPQ